MEREQAEYGALVMKMSLDSPTIFEVRPILVALLNIHNVLALPLVMPNHAYISQILNYLNMEIAWVLDTYIIDCGSGEELLE